MPDIIHTTPKIEAKSEREIFYTKEGNALTNIKDLLIKEKTSLERIRKKVDQSLANAASLPEGRVRLSRKGKNLQAYLISPDSPGPYGRYMGISERGEIPKYAQRNYDKKIGSYIDGQIVTINRFLRDYQPEKLRDIYEGMSDLRKKLVNSYTTTDEEFINQWLTTPAAAKAFREGDLRFQTERGELVRSKTEKILADLLYHRTVPYKYEQPILLENGIWINPDFRVLNVIRRQAFIWEHFGVMDDPKYCNRALEKLNDYELNGIKLGVDLIVTFETREQPFNINVAESLIERYLLS